MILSKRLKAIAGMITPGTVIADIGTDHAFLPIEMVRSGQIPCAIAMDINPGPLDIARRHIDEAHLSAKIECRLSDGMSSLLRNEVKCAVIAGMGGDLISRIITNDPDKAGELILAPHTHPETVRATLRRFSYEISDEDMIIDSENYYTIIKAVKSDDQLQEPEDYEDFFGPVLIKKRSNCLHTFLLKEKYKFSDIPQKSSYIDLINRTLEEMDIIDDDNN